MYSEIAFILFDYICERVSQEDTILRLQAALPRSLRREFIERILAQMRANDLPIKVATEQLVPKKMRKRR